MKKPLQKIEEAYIFYNNRDYFFTPILLHVFNTKSKINPIAAEAIEKTNFRLSSDKTSDCQSNA